MKNNTSNLSCTLIFSYEKIKKGASYKGSNVVHVRKAPVTTVYVCNC